MEGPTDRRRKNFWDKSSPKARWPALQWPDVLQPLLPPPIRLEMVRIVEENHGRTCDRVKPIQTRYDEDGIGGRAAMP